MSRAGKILEKRDTAYLVDKRRKVVGMEGYITNILSETQARLELNYILQHVRGISEKTRLSYEQIASEIADFVRYAIREYPEIGIVAPQPGPLTRTEKRQKIYNIAFDELATEYGGRVKNTTLYLRRKKGSSWRV